MLHLYLFSLLFIIVSSHPQCLDYQPPYNPQSQLSFCSEYQSFGCCNDDNEILERYNTISRSFPADDVNRCQNFTRSILCQKCSPYAAHLYFAEATLMPSEFPSLCPDYYNEFLAQCSQFLSVLTKSSEVMSPDLNYCYPNILNDESRTENLGQSNEDGSCLQICIREVATGLHSPTSAKSPNDGTHRIFIVEQRGVVLVFLANYTKLMPPFINIRNRVYESGRTFDERGLLDIAFHPNYTTNGLFYLHYTGLSSGQHVTRVSEFKVSADNMNLADSTYERIIIEIRQDFVNHNGGPLLFKDGYLHIFTGDGGGANDPNGHGQNKNSLLGKALRIDVNNYEGRPYSIPADNPFVNDRNARDEIYAFGLRNPWKCTLDRGDPETGEGKGRIFCADVGQNEIEEVDLIISGGNYGWNGFEGNNCFRACQNVVNHIPPIDSYNHTVGRSITGGYVYRGCESPNLGGKYLFADWWNGRLFALENKNGKWERQNVCIGGTDICINGHFSNSHSRYISSFFQDELGEVYILSTRVAQSASPSGSLYLLVDPSRRGNPLACQRRISNEVIISTDTELIPPSGSGIPTNANTPATPRLQMRIHCQTRPCRNFGIAEVRRPRGKWGRVCSLGWNRQAANVFCRQLRQTRNGRIYRYRLGHIRSYKSSYGTLGVRFWLVNIRCTGQEKNLSECSHSGWGEGECQYPPAAVICRRPIPV